MLEVAGDQKPQNKIVELLEQFQNQSVGLRFRREGSQAVNLEAAFALRPPLPLPSNRRNRALIIDLLEVE